MPGDINLNLNVGVTYQWYSIQHFALLNDWSMSYAGRPAKSVSDYELVTLPGGYCEVLVLTPPDDGSPAAIFQQDNHPDGPLGYVRIK